MTTLPTFVSSVVIAQTFRTDWVINAPAGLVSGDVLIASVSIGSLATVTPPAGWTQLLSTVFNARTLLTFYKLAGASEGATYTFTISAAIDGAHTIAAFRGADPAAAPHVAVAGTARLATVSVLVPSITTTVANCLAVWVAANNNEVALGVPAGATMRAEVFNATSYIRNWIASEPLAASGATGTRTATTAAAVDSIGHSIALAPIPDGAGITVAAWTNRGRYLMLLAFLRNISPATSFYVALITATTTPTVDINTLGQLTEIAAGSGYTAGGLAVARNATDFDVATEDDTNDLSLVQMKDLVWTASGVMPISGAPIQYAVLLTDEATVANRQVIAYWGVGATRTLTSGQTLTLQNTELRTAL